MARQNEIKSKNKKRHVKNIEHVTSQKSYGKYKTEWKIIRMNNDKDRNWKDKTTFMERK